MKNTEKLLEISRKEIVKLQREVDDCREFVKSVNGYLEYESSIKAISERDNDLHNMRIMCNYLYNRYQPTNEE